MRYNFQARINNLISSAVGFKMAKNVENNTTAALNLSRERFELEKGSNTRENAPKSGEASEQVNTLSKHESAQKRALDSLENRMNDVISSRDAVGNMESNIIAKLYGPSKSPEEVKKENG